MIARRGWIAAGVLASSSGLIAIFLAFHACNENSDASSASSLTGNEPGYESRTHEQEMPGGRRGDPRETIRHLRSSSRAIDETSKFAILQEVAPWQENDCGQAASGSRQAPWMIREETSGVRLVLVAAGTFRVPPLKTHREASQILELKLPLYVGVSEVSVSEWRRAVDGSTTEANDAERHTAMICSRYEDALAFAAHVGCRLPTSGEFMYYCAAASDYAFGVVRFISEKSASWNTVHGEENCFGLVNTQGGVWEWTSGEAGVGVAKGGIIRYPKRDDFSAKSVRAPFGYEFPKEAEVGATPIGLRLVIDYEVVMRALGR